MKNNNSKQIRTIAVVAPTEKRKEVIEWSYFNRAALSKYNLVATSGTASLLEGTINKPVFALPMEKAGGYSQMAAMMLDNKVDVIFFFENPMK
ncbi:MAG: hypothetical protein H7Y27_11175, partial [Gemmatimonadaceae bacterium]|nr:hypothetical protein [Chitinophagaceae bacterium]